MISVSMIIALSENPIMGSGKGWGGIILFIVLYGVVIKIFEKKKK